MPDHRTAAEAETVVVNGIAARQMPHRSARVRAGQTVLVHGASGGVGSGPAQPAVAAGATVIGTTPPAGITAPCGSWASSRSTTAAENVAERVRQLAPVGLDAVFDHLGGRSVTDSWKLLGGGGTLVAYPTHGRRASSAPSGPAAP